MPVLFPLFSVRTILKFNLKGGRFMGLQQRQSRISRRIVVLGPKRLKSILLACLSLPLTLFGPIRQHKGAIRSRGGSPKDKDLHMSASVSSWPTFKLEGIAKYFSILHRAWCMEGKYGPQY